MAVDSIYLQGGPCDGKTVSADEIVGGAVAYIACGGGYYVVGDGKRRPNGDLIFAYAGKTKPGPPGTGTLKAPKGLNGWHDAQRSFDVHLPAALKASSKNTRAALQSLARARKVRF